MGIIANISDPGDDCSYPDPGDDCRYPDPTDYCKYIGIATTSTIIATMRLVTNIVRIFFVYQ